jgi:hypothetical protein
MDGRCWLTFVAAVGAITLSCASSPSCPPIPDGCGARFMRDRWNNGGECQAGGDTRLSYRRRGDRAYFRERNGGGVGDEAMSCPAFA